MWSNCPNSNTQTHPTSPTPIHFWSNYFSLFHHQLFGCIPVVLLCKHKLIILWSFENAKTLFLAILPGLIFLLKKKGKKHFITLKARLVLNSRSSCLNFWSAEVASVCDHALLSSASWNYSMSRHPLRLHYWWPPVLGLTTDRTPLVSFFTLMCSLPISTKLFWLTLLVHCLCLLSGFVASSTNSKWNEWVLCPLICPLIPTFTILMMTTLIYSLF